MKQEITTHNHQFATCGQIAADDLAEIAALGYRSVICNRPDGEGGAEQPTSDALAVRAKELGLEFAYLPVVMETLDAQVPAFARLLERLPSPVLAFCRTGNRSSQLFQRANAQPKGEPSAATKTLDVVVIGGGSAGIAVTASLLRRNPNLSITIIEPSAQHYYQPGWTLVGGGVFDVRKTVRPTAEVIPAGATWLQSSVVAVEPEQRVVCLADGSRISYRQLIVCPGLQLAWERIEGLQESLGQNGVTSNYRYDLAPYTWQLVSKLRGGNALFSQPGMPIKCAGAPQKAMYLACDYWQRQGVLSAINVEFNLAGNVLFGVPEFVPPLMSYVERYGAKLAFQSNLVAVDGPAHTAWFEVKAADGSTSRVAKSFDLLHAVPPQQAPEFIRKGPLADAAGWCAADPETLQHPKYPEVFVLGDVSSTTNAKTAAAARKQVVVVANNLLAARDGKALPSGYDGYGSCPLTVERGKVILAEFGYGGKLLPSFPWDARVARRSAWWLKADFLPWFYWNGMLKGREWLLKVAAR